VTVILYLDTSALVKLYITEAHSQAVHTAVESAETVAVCRIAWAEAWAAMAKRARETPDEVGPIDTALQAFRQDWPHFLIVEVSQAVVERAGDFAETFALRGYDSVQLAAASEVLAFSPDGVVFGCFDNRLNKAAALLGLDVPW
jgi:predicted nucleic acid-binding protein